MAEAAVILDTITGNPDLPYVSWSAVGALTAYEEGASEHWRFNKGNDTALVGGVHSLSMTPNCGARGLRSITPGAGGTGYTSATVSFTGGGGTGGGVARAFVSGGAVIGYQILTVGDYDTAPTVVVSGDGTGASGTAVLDGRATFSSNLMTTRTGGANGYKLPFKDAAVFTLAVVIKKRLLGSNKGQVLFGNALTSSTSGSRAYYTNSGNMSIRTFSDVLRLITGRESLETDDVHFLALVKNKTEIINYLGSSTADKITGLTLAVVDEYWGIGNTGFGASGADYAEGIDVHEVIAYNGRALSERELGLLYRRTVERCAGDGLTIK